MANACRSNETAEDLFFKFMDAQDCPEITSIFRQLVKRLDIKSDNPREFYALLKGKLQSWRCKSLWELLDSRANQKEYGKGKICEDTQVLIIGAGPIGLRTAIEVALLGARVVIVEKRESFVRNNVLHLWPFLLTDFRSLGAKKFYGKFCSGSIDHISIRRLQSVLLKTALIFGAKLHTGVTFEDVIEPNSLEDGWKCKVSPVLHPVSECEFDVLIGADGKKNVIPGFQQIEMRGTLAIGITANFVNHCTEQEANVEEISGIAYQFNPQFFDELFEQKGIKLENIVYYKDETHYFVMTAGKASLLKRGALKKDCGPPAELLAPSNIDHSKLLEYVTDVVKYATKGTLRNLELKIVGNNRPDIAAFDFTSIKKAEHAARIIERKGSKLLVGLVGDSLLEPFWPTGSGCARGVLSALDAAWMIRSFAQDKPPLQILSERENIYRLLSGTSSENLHKDHAKYTINPATRYLHITHKRIREVYHLFDTDDPVNADFSVGSPQVTASSKASRRRRISTGAKFTSSKGRRRGRASSHLAEDFATSRMRSTSGSSMENLDSHKPLSSTQSVPLDSKVRAKPLGSVGSDEEVFKTKSRRVRIKDSGSPLTGRRGRSSTVGSSGDELKDTKKKASRKRSMSKDNPENQKEHTRRKRGFFGFGKSKPKRKSAGDSDYQSDKDNKLQKVKHGEKQERTESKFENGVILKSVQQREDEKPAFVREDSWQRRPAGSFSREQYTRRSARDIIREMEARSKGEVVPNENVRNERPAGKGLDSKAQEKHSNGEVNLNEGEKNRTNKNDNREVEEKAKIKKEDEKKKHKEEEKRRKEEERKRKDEEKRKHEEEKKRKEEEERKRKKKEEEVKKREQEKNLHNKNKQQTTPANKRSKKQRLLDEIAALSPSAKRTMPVLSTLSPEMEKENEEVQEHSVTSAVRDAAMLVMVTPLLIDGMMSKTDRKGSWLGRSSGRVRDVVNRYNTLNDMKPIIDKMNGDATPLKRPRDSVDGSEGKSRIIDVDQEDNNGNEANFEKVDGSLDVKPAPTSEKKTLQMKKDKKHLMSSPSLERLRLKLQDDPSSAEKPSSPSSPNEQLTKDFNSPIWQKTVIAQVTNNRDNSKENEHAQALNAKEEDSVDGTSTPEAVSTPKRGQKIKDFGSPIWQKTAIAVVTENKENVRDSTSNNTKNEEAKEKQPVRTKLSQQRRRSSVLPCELMEEKLTNLLNSATAQRAKESIKYMISLFRQIQKHPNDEKYHRIFKGRARFRKHVWSMRNAKLFMTSSGWTEIGSFIIFPLSKQIEGPLLLLNKYLSIIEEKNAEETSTSKNTDPSNLRRASTDLAERIMELKEALASSRNNSSSNKKSRDWKLLQRAVSLDEVNILRGTTGESGSSLMKDSIDRKSDLSQKLRLDKVNENKSSNLRRSVSENALLESSGTCVDFKPALLPLTGKSDLPQKARNHLDQADETKPSDVPRSASDNALLESTGTCTDLEPAFSRSTGKDESLKKQRSQMYQVDEKQPINLRRSVSENALLESTGTCIDNGPAFSLLAGQNESPKKQRSQLYQVDEKQPSNLRRSVSENALLESSETSENREPTFSLFTRRFSQRRVKEQEISCDLLMENPLDSEIVSVSEKQWDRKRSSSDEDEFPKNHTLSVQPERQGVRSPQEAVLEEADQLSSVLGNLIDILGSSTDTERETDSEKDTKNQPKKGKVSRNAKDKHKDDELEALCETLDILIHDHSSDSSSESSKENIRDRKPYSRKQAESRKSSFKPPVPSTRKTRQQLGKSQTLFNFENSKRSSTANGRVSRKRITKAKSVDVAALTSNVRPKERTTASRQSILKTTQKNTTERQVSSSQTRVQRQKEGSNNLASDTITRKESLPNKRSSVAATSQRTVKRPATKSKSVDMERSRTRPPVAKTKSADHQRNRMKTRRTSQVTNGASRLSSGEDEKKTPQLRTTEPSRMKTRSQSSGKGNSRPSLAKNSKGNTEDEKNKKPVNTRHENNTSAQRSSQEDDLTVCVSTDENTVNVAGSVALPDKSSSDHVTEEQDIHDAGRSTQAERMKEITKEDASIESVGKETHFPENDAHPNGNVLGEREEMNKLGNNTKVEQVFSSNVEPRKLVQDGEEQLTANRNSYHRDINSQRKEDGNPSTIEKANSDFTPPQSGNRKMTLLDLGKQQSKERLSRKELASLSLEERKKLILDAAVTKPKSKPADKRRSILQIKSRSDGNLVKNKKEAFEKPKVAHTASDSSIAKSDKQRHFRFRGRRKKSFELSSKPLEVVAEDQEEIFEETPTANGIKTPTQARDNGVTTHTPKTPIGEKIENVESEKSHSPIKISPFQLRFTKRKGFYDLEKRGSSGGMESPKQYSGECN